MRNWILSLLLVLFTTVFYGQQDSTILFNEFSISINNSSLFSNNLNNNFGFGVGAYHMFMKNKKTNVVFGFEYNRTSQFFESMYEGHYAHSTDITYTFNSFSIPIAFRINLVEKKRLFIDTGVFLDFLISSSRKGTMHTYIPDENNHVEQKEFSFHEGVNGSSPIFGLSVGLGIKIPFLKHELIFKPEYKFGLNTIYDNMDTIYNRYFRFSFGLKI